MWPVAVDISLVICGQKNSRGAKRFVGGVSERARNHDVGKQQCQDACEDSVVG